MRVMATISIVFFSLAFGIITGVGLISYEFNTNFFKLDRSDLTSVILNRFTTECMNPSWDGEKPQIERQQLYAEQLSCLKNKTLQLGRKIVLSSHSYDRLECGIQSNNDHDDSECAKNYLLNITSSNYYFEDLKIKSNK